MPEKPKTASAGDEPTPSKSGDTPALNQEALDTLAKDDTPKVSPALDDGAEAAEPLSEVKEGNDTSFQTPDEIAASESEQPQEPSEEPNAPSQVVVSHHGNRFKQWCGRHKILVTLLALLFVLGVLAAVPWTRYKIGGLFLKQTISVEVMDSQTHKPVTSAVVTARNMSAKTNNKGFADLKLPVGTTTVTVEKTYYATAKITTVVPILKPKHHIMVDFKATGRQVPLTVVNSISGKPIENAVVTAANTEGKTDRDGRLTMVLPASSSSVKATVHASGYNDGSLTIQVTGQTVAANTVRLTPSGMTYFLSNQSGKIDVVKTNLDGTNRQTVLAGTGKEDAQGTALLASRDWKYLALLSKRDGGDFAKLFLIDTSSDKVTTMDEGQAAFTLVGWSGHNFAYNVTRTKQQIWQNGYQALKAFDAETGKIATLDQTQGVGDQGKNAFQQFGNFYITDLGIVYSDVWGSQSFDSSLLSDKTSAIRLVNVTSKNKKDLKTYTANNYGYIQSRLYEPQGIYFGIYSASESKNHFYTYEDGAVKDANDITQDAFNGGTYPTYLYSPSGNNTLWSDFRDGKHTIFVGDKNGDNGKEVLKDSSYDVYGWYTNDYVLLNKDSSELYILPVGGGTPQKISNYYKPNLTFQGYGYGYGGL